MCTTLFLLSTLAMLWRRRFANRVQPEPSGVKEAVRGSSLERDLQSSGRGQVRGPPGSECQKAHGEAKDAVVEEAAARGRMGKAAIEKSPHPHMRVHLSSPSSPLYPLSGEVSAWLAPAPDFQEAGDGGIL
ncbi:hypothetical protein HPG69_011114 [Diceros bicornis minor]|uniref:Progressive rod-cone degeneration protein n=1 Tax=Diceros bicornis minor TaxID=77932 RepID=A0A7J7EGV0_DICBM|nr:hypothetical protein HPG69_011114 [Diceros bicornis minor]